MNTEEIRDQFPITKKILHRNGKEIPLIFMDHGASTHAPTPVLDTYLDMMQTKYANVHRAAHELSCVSTDMFEEVPQKMARIFGIDNLPNSGKQVVFGSNTTSVLDIASHLFAQKKGKVLTTVLEHHSNDLPHRRRGEVEHVEVDKRGMLIYDQFEEKLQNHDIKLVAVSAASNVTGYMPDVHRIARMAHDHGAKILVDAAQRTAHAAMEIKPLDHPEHLDYVAIGGHKMYAPFGSSALIGTTEYMDSVLPYIPGGGTVSFVSSQEEMYLSGPDRHQPGTPNIAGTVAMGAAADFILDIGLDYIRKHEVELLDYSMKRLSEIDDFELMGDIPLDKKLGVISFNIEGMLHNTISEKLDAIAGLATRNGCFCAHPYVSRLLGIDEDRMKQIRISYDRGEISSIPGGVRATIGIYNTIEEMEIFVNTVEHIAKQKLMTH